MIDKVKWIDDINNAKDLKVFDKWTNGFQIYTHLPFDFIALYIVPIIVFGLTNNIYLYLMLQFLLLIYQWWSYEFLNKIWQWVLLIMLFIIQVPFIIIWLIPLINGLRKNVGIATTLIIFDTIIYLIFEKMF